MKGRGGEEGEGRGGDRMNGRAAGGWNSDLWWCTYFACNSCELFVVVIRLLTEYVSTCLSEWLVTLFCL